MTPILYIVFLIAGFALLAVLMLQSKRARDELADPASYPPATCTIYWYGDDAHDGAGWYYVDDEYPEEGSVGAFLTWQGASEHAVYENYVKPTPPTLSEFEEKHKYMKPLEPAEWFDVFTAKKKQTE